MKNCGLLLATISLALVQASFGQELTPDVDGLTVESVSATLTRLSWTGPQSLDCESVITYSVFRDTNEDFSPSVRNRVATGLSRMTYLAKEPLPDGGYYYYVKADVKPAPCTLHGGYIVVYPLDMGETFSVTIGEEKTICTAATTSELVCPAPLPDFHAVIASQGGHDYLIGCEYVDYGMGAWTCVNLTPRVYAVGVHSQTLTVWHSGMAEINPRTGKIIAFITPVFSILARIK